MHELYKNLPERITRRIRKRPSGCWEWVGQLNADGYGVTSANGKTVRAHRVVYAAVNGKIKAGMCILHSCDNPPCCNPNHLSEGTQRENMKDRDRKSRQHDQRHEGNNNAKLTWRKVTDIRRAYDSGSVSKSELAAEYNISTWTIHKVVKRKAWLEQT